MTWFGLRIAPDPIFENQCDFSPSARYF
jgi:hypothetical protein